MPVFVWGRTTGPSGGKHCRFWAIFGEFGLPAARPVAAPYEAWGHGAAATRKRRPGRMHHPVCGQDGNEMNFL